MLSNKVKNMKIDLILIQKLRIQILSHTRISAFFNLRITINSCAYVTLPIMYKVGRVNLRNSEPCLPFLLPNASLSNSFPIAALRSNALSLKPLLL